MIFTRSIPPKNFRQYENYKPYLRVDFEYCCAYCLRPEANFGEEACGEIDHFCPQSVADDLICEYTNLYWSCRECNSNKAEDWPDADEIANGKRFVDPCKDDLTEHYSFEESGKIIPLTPQAEYSINSMLLWRDSLVNWRRETIEAFKEMNRIELLLKDPRVHTEVRELNERILGDYKKKINPPVFDRARRRARASRRSPKL